jgi:hypothetical protein
VPSPSTTPSQDPALGPAVHQPGIRQVALPAGKTTRRKNKGRGFPGGIVAEPAVTPLQVTSATDLLFPPIIPGPMSVQVGNLPTTSPTPGRATKEGDPLKAFGAVIGKASRRLLAGQGLIPSLIALQ